MTQDTPEFEAILERLRRLERQNQQLRRTGILAAIVLSALALMGQAAPRSPRVIQAQRFALVDARGNVRGWMGVVGNGSELTLGNSNAQPMLRLLVSTDASELHFFGSRKSGMNLGVDSAEPTLSMTDAGGSGRAGITFVKGGPSLTLQDGRRFSAIVGTTQAKSGSGYTSAASVVLLDKDNKVIWRAP